MIEPEIIHYGVPGMKWGKRRAQSGGDAKEAKMPTKTNYALTGRMGKVDAYKDPAAKAQRVTAGKLRLAALGGSVLGASLSVVSNASGNPAVKAGAQAVSSMLSLATAGVTTAAQVNGYQAINKEQASRAN